MILSQEQALVSIIMPAHNSQETISEAIFSVINQRYQNWELLITNDGSVDKTLTIINSFAEQDPRIKPMSNHSSLGAAQSRNNSLSRASGRFIAFLDSDDYWHPDKLALQLDYMNQNDLALCFSAYQKINGDGSERGIVFIPTKIDYQDLLKHCIIGCLTVVLDASKVGIVKMPAYKRRQDYCLWLDILRQGHVAGGINEVLAYYRESSSSLSGNKLKAAYYQWKVYREYEKLSLFLAIYYFINYAIRGYLKFLK